LYPIGYIPRIVFTLIRSAKFDAWLSALADQRAKARILIRLTRAETGNLGACSPVGEGVSEMRFQFGPGYRVYFFRHGPTIYYLLAGGDKSSQQRDIETAKAMAAELKEESA
jgi:putative addiction module killer protein